MKTKLNHTAHSQERWNERFSYLDINYEWDSAKKATKKQRVIISSNCKGSSPDNKHYGIVYYISQSGVVFVCRGDEMHLVTVMSFIQKSITAKKTSNKQYRQARVERRQRYA